MPKDIPSEAQAAIDAFNAEEAVRAAQRKGYGEQQESKSQRRLREKVQSGTVFTPRELMSFAQQEGWELDSTEGSHHKFKHPDGRVLTIPARAGQQQTVQPDTARRILGSIFPKLFSNKSE